MEKIKRLASGAPFMISTSIFLIVPLLIFYIRDCFTGNDVALTAIRLLKKTWANFLEIQ